MINRHEFHKMHRKSKCNVVPFANLLFPSRPFRREIRKMYTYPIVMQNSLCLPALRYMTRFADAKIR